MVLNFTVIARLKDDHVEVSLPRKFRVSDLLLVAGTLWERTVRIMMRRGVSASDIQRISNELILDAQNKVSTVTAMKLMKMIKENDDEHQTDQPEDSPV